MKTNFEHLTYYPETGKIFSSKSNRFVGTTNSHGYIKINIGSRVMAAHRLAFYLMTGKFPEAPIDHINRNKSDNRWENLRLANKQGNAANSAPRKNNNFKGVRKSRNGFSARITINGKEFYLGYFSCRLQAAEAYNKAALKAFGEFANLNRVK